MAPSSHPAPAGEPFAVPGFHGRLVAAYRPHDLEAAVARLLDPASAKETLHWGRNYLYSVEIDTVAGPLDVVVKQFRNQGLVDRWRRRLGGSKAAKSWHGAHALRALGLATPEPVMLVESEAHDGPSFFVARRLTGVFESRYFFRALNGEPMEGPPVPELDPGLVLTEIARTLCTLHDGGIWHRDVSVGNLLIRPGEGPSPPTIHLVDLNRLRVGRRLGTSRRTRDLCRLRIFDRRLQEIFLRAYWRERTAVFGWKRFLYRLYQRSFLLKIEAKELYRHPLRALLGLLAPRRAHVHIPPPPEAASARDRVVWDYLSDQPHQHAGRFERLAVRVADARQHGKEVGVLVSTLPRLWRRYRKLKRELYRQPVAWDGVGVAVRPWTERPEALLTTLDELGVRRVLLRLHPWQERHDEEEELARELDRRGYELAFALPQNRALVRDLGRWRAAITELAERFKPFGRHFQVGQAINRSKWGVWNHREYLALAATATEVLRSGEEVEVLGPAIIDYEFYRTIGILNVPSEGVYFDVVSSLLYVDRRGAPENRQLGFDTVDKVVQLKAIAETAANSSSRCWITEVNWPLWEGPHSPAGRDVSVDPETQADYLARYYLLTLGTGMVERVYWWQLVARGYGLAYPSGDGRLAARPGLAALSTLHRQLAGTTFLGPLGGSNGHRLYRFRAADDRELVVGWSVTGAAEAELPRPAAEVVGRDGAGAEGAGRRRVPIDGSPRYCWLVPE